MGTGMIVDLRTAGPLMAGAGSTEHAAWLRGRIDDIRAGARCIERMNKIIREQPGPIPYDKDARLY